MNKKIEIDFEVYKYLTMMRKSEEDTYNDVIRELLNLDTYTDRESTKDSEHHKSFISKGVEFPHKTKLRALYKGRYYNAEVLDGKIIYDTETHHSPSSAAIAVTGNNVNGWAFWECRRPGEKDWSLLRDLRD